jgi:hypothetical protein
MEDEQNTAICDICGHFSDKHLKRDKGRCQGIYFDEGKQECCQCKCVKKVM